MRRSVPRGWFVTGTDTGVGKTLVTAKLMEAFSRSGLVVAGMKPIASGCELIDGKLENDDARVLRARCTREVPYSWVNPCALEPPIAPSIALDRIGEGLDPKRILDAYACLGEGADVLLVEGVGGWRVPLDKALDIAGLAGLLNLPVLLVVGFRLGCINHALLTAQVLPKPLAGWFANCTDPTYDTGAETVALLTERLAQPPLAVLPHLQVPGEHHAELDVLIDQATQRLWAAADP